MARKIILISAIVFIFLLIVVVGAVSLKSKFATANFIGNEMNIDISGKIRYSRQGSCLTGQLSVKGFISGETYDLAIYSREGDERLANACDDSKCGFDGEESFLILSETTVAKNGAINDKINECRLPVGEYNDLQFMIIDQSTSQKAWTWEDREDSDLDIFECAIYSSGSVNYTAGNPWCGDISKFTII